MSSQHLPDSWRRELVGSVMGKILINVKQMIVYMFMGNKICGLGPKIGPQWTMMIPHYFKNTVEFRFLEPARWDCLKTSRYPSIWDFEGKILVGTYKSCRHMHCISDTSVRDIKLNYHN